MSRRPQSARVRKEVTFTGGKENEQHQARTPPPKKGGGTVRPGGYPQSQANVKLIVFDQKTNNTSSSGKTSSSKRPQSARMHRPTPSTFELDPPSAAAVTSPPTFKNEEADDRAYEEEQQARRKSIDASRDATLKLEAKRRLCKTYRKDNFTDEKSTATLLPSSKAETVLDATLKKVTPIASPRGGDGASSTPCPGANIQTKRQQDDDVGLDFTDPPLNASSTPTLRAFSAQGHRFNGFGREIQQKWVHKVPVRPSSASHAGRHSVKDQLRCREDVRQSDYQQPNSASSTPRPVSARGPSRSGSRIGGGGDVTPRCTTSSSHYKGPSQQTPTPPSIPSSKSRQGVRATSATVNRSAGGPDHHHGKQPPPSGEGLSVHGESWVRRLEKEASELVGDASLQAAQAGVQPLLHQTDFAAARGYESERPTTSRNTDGPHLVDVSNGATLNAVRPQAATPEALAATIQRKVSSTPVYRMHCKLAPQLLVSSARKNYYHATVRRSRAQFAVAHHQKMNEKQSQRGEASYPVNAAGDFVPNPASGPSRYSSVGYGPSPSNTGLVGERSALTTARHLNMDQWRFPVKGKTIKEISDQRNTSIPGGVFSLT